MPIRIPDAVVIPGVFDGICQDYNEKDGTCSAMYHMCSVCPDRKKGDEHGTSHKN